MTTQRQRPPLRQRPSPNIDVPLATYHEATADVEAANEARRVAARRRARAVVVMWEAGKTMDQLAEMLGVSKSRIAEMMNSLDKEAAAS